MEKTELSTHLKNNFTKIAAIAGFCLASALPVQAADWSNTNVQLLNGSDFELGADNRTIFTIENATGWKYGDTFFFMDVTDPFDTKDSSIYAEFSPRLSLSKLTGKKLSYGIVKDVMVASTLETGEGVRGYLLGVGLPLDIPGFAFANVNLYGRKSERAFAAQDTDTGGQVTLTWNRPFSIGSAKLNFEGFFDYAFSENGGSSPKEDNIVAAPRLMLNLGKNIQVGIEQQIWRNKFGIDGVDEDATQAIVKWTF
jgi:nucleoside-specific outer membrane channel protein Tsx